MMFFEGDIVTHRRIGPRTSYVLVKSYAPLIEEEWVQVQWFSGPRVTAMDLEDKPWNCLRTNLRLVTGYDSMDRGEDDGC